MNQNKSRPAPVKGINHVFAATSYSLAALRRLSRETAFQHEVILYVGVLLVFALIGANLGEYMIATVLFLLLVAFETLNTAIEVIVDHLAEDWAEFARDAKDYGSLSVMLLLLSNGCFFAYVLWQHLA
ncbi:MAG: diacylglycerol kinase [Rhodobacteraceae bacterium]|nr:diacylglycerol kinase [Paracoccaceae bacterium]